MASRLKFQIKRPVAIIGFTALITSCLTITMPKSIILFSLALFLIITVLHSITVKKHIASLLLCFTVAIATVLYVDYYTHILHNKIQQYNQIPDLQYQGYITSFYKVNSVTCYTVQLEQINGQNIKNFSVHLYASDGMNQGEQICFNGKLNAFTPKNDIPYYYARNIYGSINYKQLKTIGYKNSFSVFMSKIKQTLLFRAKKLYPSTPLSIVMSMGYSDKSLLAYETKQAFQYAGLSHVLVVSGLHVGILTLVIQSAFMPLPFSKKIKNCMCAVAIFFLMGLIGFSPSILRAGITAIALLLSKNFLRRCDTFTVLGIILLVTVLQNPYQATDIGLLLSYSAYTGVAFANTLSVKGKYKKLRHSLRITLFALLFTMPVLAMAGMHITVLSIVMNLLCSPLIGLICVLSFFTPMLSFFGGLGAVFNSILVPINTFAIEGLLFLVGLAYKYFQFALVNLGADEFQWLIAIAVAAIGFSFLQFSNKKLRVAFVLSISLLGILGYQMWQRNIVNIIAFDSGKEAACVIQCQDQAFLILAEQPKEETIVQFMQEYHITSFDKIYINARQDKAQALLQPFSKQICAMQGPTMDKESCFTLAIYQQKDASAFILECDGIKIGFGGNGFDFSEFEGVDYYFFGTKLSQHLQAKTTFYFYPASKKQEPQLAQMDAKALYGPLTLRMDIKKHTQFIVKDVRNFGNEL